MQHCDGCGAVRHTDELSFRYGCQESYCARNGCVCSCSRVQIAEYDAVHGAGAYERMCGAL